MLFQRLLSGMEEDFFITEYMSCGRDELKCTIKKLYSDFIVNEITPDGTVLGKFGSSYFILLITLSIAHGVVLYIV